MPAEVRLPAPLARLFERANPVLVKEVRAALRGRAFAIGFSIVLVLALVASLLALVVGVSSESRAFGVGYLATVTGVFMLGANVLVPFSAMAAMSAEHDEGALELLQLSGITSLRVVLGKLGSATIQAVLLAAAFLPFLSFAALLPGVDLAAIAGGVGSVLCVAIALSSLAILVGAALKKRWARVVAYVLLAFFVLWFGPLLAMVSLSVSGMGAPGPGPFTPSGTGLVLVAVCAFVAAIACALAAGRLTHPEENRSSGVRAVSTAAVLAACAAAVAADSPGALLGWGFVALGVGLPVLFVGVGEPTRLPRAVLLRAVRGGPAYALGAPWLPGGGRAVLLVLVHVGLVVAAVFAGAARLGSASALPSALAVTCVSAYAGAALLLPAGLLAPWIDRPWAGTLARLGALFLPVFALLVPTFLAFLAGAGGEAFGHVGNPGHLASDVLDDGRLDDQAGLAFTLGALAVALALNAPRVVRSLGEVARERRRRAGTATPAAEAVHAATQP